MSDEANGGGEGQQQAGTGSTAPVGQTPGQTENRSNYGKLPGSQEELNQILTQNKKGLQRELAEARAKLQAHDQLNRQVEELLEGRPLEELIPEFQKSREALMTAEELLKQKEEQHGKKLKDAQDRAERAETEFRNLKITRDIADSLADKASTPAARQHLIEMAAKRAQINSKTGEVEIQMEFEEEGVKVKKGVPPSKAIELMEADVANYGPFFKATVGSGTGAAAGGGHQRRLPNGMVDPTQMSMEEYMQHRAEILKPNY